MKKGQEGWTMTTVSTVLKGIGVWLRIPACMLTPSTLALSQPHNREGYQKKARDANKVRFFFCWLQGARLVAQAWSRMRVQKERMRYLLSIHAISTIVWREKEKVRKRRKEAIGLVGSHCNVLWCVHGENVKASDSGTIGKMGGWVRRLFAKRTSMSVWGVCRSSGNKQRHKEKKTISASFCNSVGVIHRYILSVILFLISNNPSCAEYLPGWSMQSGVSSIRVDDDDGEWLLFWSGVVWRWGRRDGSTVKRFDRSVDGARWGKGDTGMGKGGEGQKEGSWLGWQGTWDKGQGQNKRKLVSYLLQLSFFRISAGYIVIRQRMSMVHLIDSRLAA